MTPGELVALCRRALEGDMLAAQEVDSIAATVDGYVAWREEAEAWMHQARHELHTLGMNESFCGRFPISAGDYRALAERCPLPQEDDDA